MENELELAKDSSLDDAGETQSWKITTAGLAKRLEEN
jgi:hypothetical protein